MNNLENMFKKHDFTMFLDFDGVLHRKMIGDFEFLPNLKKVLDLFPNIMVVISSDWRHDLKTQDYHDIFGSYVSRIVGKTPTMMGLKHIRQLEILAYAKQHSLQRFIAVDDDCRNELFDDNCNWLFKTDYYCGLDEETLNNLIKFIKINLA